MEKIIMPRNSGKTTLLIKKASETNSYIVCSTQSECIRLQDEALYMGLRIPLPITYSEFLNGEYDKSGIKSIMIDNVELFLQSITNVRIKAISLSSEGLYRENKLFMSRNDIDLCRDILQFHKNTPIRDNITGNVVNLASLVIADKSIERVTLCGSSKFKEQFDQANERLTLQGKIVIPMGVYGHLMSDEEKKEKFTDEVKTKLDQLHFRKIDLSDSIYVVNVGGYIGESTKKEIEYATSTGKRVEYLEPPVKFSCDLPI